MKRPSKVWQALSLIAVCIVTMQLMTKDRQMFSADDGNEFNSKRHSAEGSKSSIVANEKQTMTRRAEERKTFLENQELTPSPTPALMPSKSVCPTTVQLFPSKLELEGIIERKINFYVKGEGLKTLVSYLNRQIDRTFALYNANFVPDPNNKEFVPHEEMVKFLTPAALDKDHSIQNLTNYLQAYFDRKRDPRGGYGQPLPGKFMGHSRNSIHEERRVRSVDEPDTLEKWDIAHGEVGPNCQNLTYIGTTPAKLYCAAVIREDKSATDECHFLSIGSNDEWNFEQIVMDTMPECHIHTFDCTLEDGRPKAKPPIDNIHFYDACMAANDRDEWEGKRKYRSYESMLRIAGISHIKPKYLKMDIEGSELDVLPTMIQRMDPKSLPEQMMVEMHYMTRMTGVDWMLRSLSAGELYNFFSVLFIAGGYIPVEFRTIPRCPSCLEVLFVQVLCPLE